MKFATAVHEGETFVGLISGEETHILPLVKAEQAVKGKSVLPNSMLDCIHLGEAFIDRVKEIANLAPGSLHIPLETVRTLAPIPRPTKNIFCVGKNYVEHAMEMGSKRCS